MQFKTTITQNDFKAFQKVAAQNSGIESGKKSFFKNLAIWFVIGVITVILLNLFKFKNIEFHYITSIVTSLVMFAIIIFVLYKNTNRMLPFTNGAILGEHEYIFSDEEIIDQRGKHKFCSTYDSILKIVETDNNLFLFIDKIAGYLINKDSISSEFSPDEISKFLRGKCNNLN
ncbi:YcxB family protein [Desulfogranum japonicum]|uniref:YcxB family protein n=1 Tax=Desulfogranum japonicum TaxID=231447 RepID=UPI00048B0A59|nr:YcxB family protein [Desulfogranum japonicum]